jgi:uncharacterized membrane protein YphA (DoxX/SURF4 family)
MTTLGILYGGWILLFIRIMVGIVMIYYGLPKIKDLKKNAEDFVEMGFSQGWFWGAIVVFVEFFGGVALILGFFIEIMALLFGTQMLIGTFWKILYVKKKFPDWSYDVLLLALCLILITFGGGLLTLTNPIV